MIDSGVDRPALASTALATGLSKVSRAACGRAPTNGQAGHPQHLLDGAVLTGDAMQHWENHVGRVRVQPGEQSGVDIAYMYIDADVGQRLRDLIAGPQGHLPLRRQAARQDEYPLQVAHHAFPNVSRSSRSNSMTCGQLGDALANVALAAGSRMTAARGHGRRRWRRNRCRARRRRERLMARDSIALESRPVGSVSQTKNPPEGLVHVTSAGMVAASSSSIASRRSRYISRNALSCSCHG